MHSEDEKFMRIALDCAALGRGAVEPNPMVGAVIVRGGEELSRGRHRKFGAPHAEIEALAAAKATAADVRGATMYVTLEPCCHHGKTPPCTEAIIGAGIARVVVAMADPDKNVAGGGIEALRAAGIEVALGVLAAEARGLLAAYVKLRTQGRPWVICKWAQTADGYLALPAGRGRWISSEAARGYVHELRGLCDGVCIGVGTVLADDPLLTNRSGKGKQPARVVLDSSLKTPPDCRLVKTVESSPVILAASRPANADRAEKLQRAGVEVLELPAGTGGVDLPSLLDELGRRQWTYLLVEGGAKVLTSFISAGLADELVVFRAAEKAGPAKPLPHFDIADVEKRFGLGEAETRQFGEDVMLRYVLGA